MLETELKLQVPTASRAAVLRALKRGRTTRVHLCAQYFDTADGRLAAAGLTVRVRREGGHWVQAVKGVGDGLLERLEHEVRLPAARVAPAFDPGLHAASPVDDVLRRALGGAAATLAPRFETDVWRTRRALRAGATRIEIAFDEGVLRAGERTLPVCELELELLGGPVSGLIDAAAHWAARHGLWVDLRSKAERGHWLAAGSANAPLTKTLMPIVARGAAPAAALRECVRCALTQVLANGSWLAAGAGEPEHVHQARVGLRRLTTLLREFGSWSSTVDPQWIEGARTVIRALSPARDRDALAAWLWPQLRAAGAPSLNLGDGTLPPDPALVFRGAATTQWVLQLMTFVQQPPALDGSGSVRALARPGLARLHRQIRRAGQVFHTLDDVQRHRARKRLKRLRYAAESLSALWPEKAWTEYVLRLRQAQEALGQLQDVAAAEGLLREAAARDVGAAFAMGWLAARREVIVAEAGRALGALGALPRFLR